MSISHRIYKKKFIYLNIKDEKKPLKTIMTYPYQEDKFYCLEAKMQNGPNYHT